jgi:hypothetical protein
MLPDVKEVLSLLAEYVVLFMLRCRRKSGALPEGTRSAMFLKYIPVSFRSSLSGHKVLQQV